MSETEQYISRIDQNAKHVHGWYVRLWYNGQEWATFFADKKHGGKKKALQKARKKKEQLLKKRSRLPDPAIESYDTRFYYPEARNNSTGVCGVYRTIREMRSGEKYPYYQTTVHVQKGTATTRARSIAKHGEIPAFLQICEFRREKLREIYGDRFDRARFDQSVIEHVQKLSANKPDQKMKEPHIC